MRPRLLTDEMIAGAIRDLSAQGRVTGVAVRALLLQRYGAKGSVSRIYAQLQAARMPTPAPKRAVTEMVDPRSLEEALARAALAEERELAHQMRWAREMESMRTQLMEAQRAAQETTELRRRLVNLQQALAAVQQRITPATPSRSPT